MRRTHGRRALMAASAVVATTAAIVLGGALPAGATPDPSLDTGVLRTVTQDADLGFPSGQHATPPAGIQTNELAPGEQESSGTDRSNTVDKGLSPTSPTGVPIVEPTAVDGSPGLVTSFQGLNGFEERSANNGNQFSTEPPDQALCVGNGYVFEAVNTVLRVYDPAGTAASEVTDLNTFFGYPAAIDRQSLVFGPFVTDPTCLFDNALQRWFVTVLTLEVNPTTGAFTGRNTLDTAVSKSADPLGGFRIYRLPVQDDGTQGTPSHAGCPCIGDYPHIATDEHGFYITTNEYPFDDSPGIFGNNFNGAQIYAYDKTALANGNRNANVVQFSKTALKQGKDRVPGFTLAPAQVPDTAYQTADNGTEYFLSSVAGEEAQPDAFTGQAAVLGVYALTNTASLSSAHPQLSLAGSLRPSEPYVNPPLAEQKYGPTPLADLCSVTDCLGFGIGQFSEGPIATNDSRMLQVYYANGHLYGAINTGVQVTGQLQAGIAWFLVDPGTSPSSSAVAGQGYVAVANQNVIFPAIAAMANGTGAMVYTLTGPGYYPSAAYSLVTSAGVSGPVNVSAPGVGPQDGFSEYAPAGDVGSGPRPRWGDYSAAVPVGSTIWMATEYIGQQCSFAVYQHDPTCGNTRAPLINWATRISAVTP
jgi:hypothetical protein